MDEFDAWLEKMATEPLPGGVAAAALAAAMGAALVAKVTTGRRRPTAAGLVDLAHASRIRLLQLAADDEAAYRLVLDTRRLPPGDEARRRACRQATDLPLTVAETCHRLLAALPDPGVLASPALAVDFEIGRRLLAAGCDAGLRAGAQNLDAWGRDVDLAGHRQRLAALRGGELT
ncbi:MAG: cyclodeaminase/cyclohydrolase family protein [Anaerolineae bacterium]